MFIKLLQSMFSARRGGPDDGVEPEFPAERLRTVRRAHAKAPREQHLNILFDEMRVGPHPIAGLADSCVRDSGAQSPPLKAFHRPLASYFLARYFLYSLALDGVRAECGVFSGASALLMCRAATTRTAEYAGAGLHLIDSFAGISPPQEEDLIAVRAQDGRSVVMKPGFDGGAFASPLELVRHTLREFPAVAIHSGWIPAVFADLPETRWCFVHLDVDLYEPTLACLDYFYPRLVNGGVIICDDYGAPLFPGAHRAWDEFCAKHDLPYIVLDTGQSVILKQAADARADMHGSGSLAA
jgi:O-methyltransferase